MVTIKSLKSKKKIFINQRRIFERKIKPKFQEFISRFTSLSRVLFKFSLN